MCMAVVEGDVAVRGDEQSEVEELDYANSHLKGQCGYCRRMRLFFF